MQQASSAQAVLVPAQQTSSRVQIVCGGSSIKGRRPQQEDVLLIHTDTSSHSSSSQVLQQDLMVLLECRVLCQIIVVIALKLQLQFAWGVRHSVAPHGRAAARSRALTADNFGGGPLSEHFTFGGNARRRYFLPLVWRCGDPSNSLREARGRLRDARIFAIFFGSKLAPADISGNLFKILCVWIGVQFCEIGLGHSWVKKSFGLCLM